MKNNTFEFKKRNHVYIAMREEREKRKKLFFRKMSTIHVEPLN